LSFVICYLSFVILRAPRQQTTIHKSQSQNYK